MHPSTQQTRAKKMKIDDQAEEIAKLIREEKINEAHKRWREITEDLKRFECVALKDKVFKLVNHTSLN